MKTLFAALLFAWSFALNAQWTLSGKVTDASGSPLPFVTIQLPEIERAVNTDAFGAYSIGNLPSGIYSVSCVYAGYQTITREVTISGVDVTQDFVMVRDPQTEVLEVNPDIAKPAGMEEVELTALKAISLAAASISVSAATPKTPVTYWNVKPRDIERLNNGEDLPRLLRFTPSLITTSDAGNGVGYTGLRIRGSDASRINVTINGIPLNDSESQGVFWVNTPDLASSADLIQIQRGVGTSTNGAGAFGGTVKVNTLGLDSDANAEVINAYGSFNTWKHTVKASTGKINNRWAFETRLSQITSDGFIDRASSDLKSYYVAGGFDNGRTSVKGVVFGGRERTYQSWWGTPESRLENDVAGMEAHAANNFLTEAQTANLLNAGRTYNFYEYENQVDNYNQDHYQVHIGQSLGNRLNLKLAGHYTWGRGFFEEFQQDQAFSAYGLPPLVVDGQPLDVSTDVVRRLWLDNDFYGGIGSLTYRAERIRVTLGGGWNRYDGDHFGELTWMEFANGTSKDDIWYLSNGVKTDLNIYAKALVNITEKLSGYVDVQQRNVDYETAGTDANLRNIAVTDDHTFFNPKAGLTWDFTRKDKVYASYAVANREPIRADYVDNATDAFPRPENLQDIEFGYQRSTAKYYFGVNGYYMLYQDQLVPTGAINEVGTPLRQNVDESFRRGVELELSWNIMRRLNLWATATYSQNQITEFVEQVPDYTNDEVAFQTIIHRNADIAFSPEITAAGILNFLAVRTERHDIEVAWQTKYVGDQFLDNTSNAERSIDAFLVNDLRLTYRLKETLFRELNINFLANNVLDQFYSSNGYTYSYIFGSTVTENFFYPQAGRNYSVSLALKF